MFQKQNIKKNSFSCEPCEGSCEPFQQIIHTLKAFIFNTYSPHVNDVNHFLARAREGINDLLFIYNSFYSNIDHKTNTSKNTLTRAICNTSFTSFTWLLSHCLYKSFHVNHSLKSFTRSFTSFTWN